jgi:hypothetical protein
MAASCGDAWLDRVTGRKKRERVDVVGVACEWTGTSALARTIRPRLSGDVASRARAPPTLIEQAPVILCHTISAQPHARRGKRQGSVTGCRMFLSHERADLRDGPAIRER